MFDLGHILLGVGLFAAVAESPLYLCASHADGLVVGNFGGILELVFPLLVFLDLQLDVPLVLVDSVVFEHLVLLLLLLLELLVDQCLHLVLLQPAQLLLLLSLVLPSVVVLVLLQLPLLLTLRLLLLLIVGCQQVANEGLLLHVESRFVLPLTVSFLSTVSDLVLQVLPVALLLLPGQLLPICILREGFREAGLHLLP
jgi:hypothetical protein